jgi:CubicO group peptidase (beta-lactamase class C family)
MSEPTPEAHGIPSEALLALVDALEAQGLDPHALAVARHGDVVFECAWRPYSLDQPALVYSASKTFTSLAIGFLDAEGALALDDSVGDLLGLPNPHGLTVRHLLTMNTGHDAEQIDSLLFDVRTLLSVPPAAAPGTRFAYNSDATYALSCIVTALTGERLTDYLRPRLLDPLGIGQRWMKPARTVEQGFSGYHLTVGDLACVAIMLGDGGRYRGVRIVPEGYVRELSQAWSDTRDPGQPEDPDNDWARGYGYQVWLGRQGFRLDGAYGQFGLVLPERGLVIAYQGATLDTQRTLNAFWRFADAVADEPVPVDPAATAALQRRAEALDGRDALVLLAGAPDGAIDTTGWRIEEAGSGWTVTQPSGQTLPVGTGEWARTTLPIAAPPDAGDPVVRSPHVADGTHVAVAARGARDDDGVLVHLVVPTSPHRLILRRREDGRISGAWHTVPLQGPTLGALAVPEWVVG